MIQFDQIINQDETESSRLSLKKVGLTFLLYLIIFVALFSPVIFSGHLIAPNDGIIQNVPNFLGVRSLWTQCIYSGYPLLADPQVQFFYPLPLILSHLPEGWNIYVVSGYVFAGTFLYIYLKMVTRSEFASLAGGIFFALSGYMTCEAMHVHVVQNSMWFIAMLTIFEGSARNLLAKKWALLLGSIVICMCSFNGHMQTFSYMLGTISCYAILRTTSLKDNAERLHYLTICYASIGLGLGMSAIQLLPSTELVAFSARKSFTFQDFLAFDMHPLESFGILLPFLFGGAPDGFVKQPYFGNFICPPHFLYLGYIPLILSLTAVISFPKNRFIIFWSILASMAFLLCFGDSTPLAWWLYHLPPFCSFRCLHRTLAVASLANSILAASAIALIEEHTPVRKKMLMVAGVIVVLFVGELCIVPMELDILSGQATKYGITSLGGLPWNNPALGISVVMFLVSCASLIVLSIRPNTKLAKCCVLTAVLADLLFLGWNAQGGGWRIDSADPKTITPPATATKYVPLASQNGNRILSVRGGSGSLEELPCNLSRLWNVPSASGYEPLMLTRYGDLLNMTEGGFLQPSWPYTGNSRAFDLLSIKYATTAANDSRLEELVDEKGNVAWKKIDSIGGAGIHENARVLPHAWLVHKTEVLVAGDVLQTIKSAKFPDGREFDPLDAALIEEDKELSVKQNSDCSSKEDVKIEYLSNDGLKLKATVNSPAMLIVSDIFYPWWRVTVDGKPGKIIRADYVLRGVPLEKGEHLVQFNLVADSLTRGIIVSSISCFLLLAGFFYLHRASKKKG